MVEAAAAALKALAEALWVEADAQGLELAQRLRELEAAWDARAGRGELPAPEELESLRRLEAASRPVLNFPQSLSIGEVRAPTSPAPRPPRSSAPPCAAPLRLPARQMPRRGPVAAAGGAAALARRSPWSDCGGAAGHCASAWRSAPRQAWTTPSGCGCSQITQV